MIQYILKDVIFNMGIMKWSPKYVLYETLEFRMMTTMVSQVKTTHEI